jgi:hypothetical protein
MYQRHFYGYHKKKAKELIHEASILKAKIRKLQINQNNKQETQGLLLKVLNIYSQLNNLMVKGTKFDLEDYKKKYS